MKTVVIDSFAPLEEGWHGRWKAELSEKDYDELTNLCDEYGVHLLVAALAQISEDQGWMTAWAAKQVAQRAADDLQDQWQSEAELAEERRRDR